MPSRLVAALMLAALVVAGGACSRPPDKGRAKPDKKKEDQADVALESFRRASTVSGYREALNLTGAAMSADERARLVLPAKTRQLLKDRFLLDEDELKEVDAITFQPLDAFHVEFCYQLRDAAKLLEQPGLSPLEQAARCVDWVMRQVILQERTDELLPPQAVRRLGFGTAQERALIVLDLLHQFQVDGCLVALHVAPSGAPGPLLVGVVLQQNKKTDVYLFDPRLGRALPGPGGQGVATLADVRRQPELLNPTAAAAGASAAAAEATPAAAPPAKAELTIFAAPSLYTLSPRMKFLEDQLADRERVRLAHEPDKLLARLEAATDSTVRVWHGKLPAVTAVRALRAYLPVSEGGLDKLGRMEFSKALLRLSLQDVDRTYERMNLLGPNQLVPEGQRALQKLAQELHAKYVEAPRMFLLRGQMAQVHQRLAALQKPLSELELDVLNEDRILAWRDRVNRAFLAGPKNAAAVFAEDQYLLSLLEGRTDLGYAEVKDLTMIVLKAIREPLSRDMSYVQAMTEHEEAEYVHARQKARGKEGLVSEWHEAANAWQGYQKNYGLTTARLETRLERLRAQARNREWYELLLETHYLAADLHKATAARYALARARQAAGETGSAIEELQALNRELTLLKDHAIHKDLTDFVSASRGALRGGIFESFQKDLGPDGGFAWLRRAAALQLREWTAKK